MRTLITEALKAYSSTKVDICTRTLVVFFPFLVIIGVMLIPLPTSPLATLLITRMRLSRALCASTTMLHQISDIKLYKAAQRHLRCHMRSLRRRTNKKRTTLKYYIMCKITECRRRGETNWGKYAKMMARQSRYTPRAAALPSHATGPMKYSPMQAAPRNSTVAPITRPPHAPLAPPTENPTPLSPRNIATACNIVTARNIATSHCTGRERDVSNLPFTDCAPVETLSNLFHTSVARRNVWDNRPASSGAHLTTQQTPPADLQLVVALIPNEGSGTVTVKLSARPHARSKPSLHDPRIHHLGGCNLCDTPKFMGGAGCMYSATETREMDNALVMHGLWADWDYQWTEGDCGFDSLSRLSGVPSSTIRNSAMDILSTRLAEGITEDTADTKGLIQEMISEHRERGGCENLNELNYIIRMRKGARAGGLWMDNLAAGLAGEALHANIEIHEYAGGSVTPQGGSAQNPGWPMYRLLYTRGPPGHFTPLSRHPIQTRTTTHTQPGRTHPEHATPAPTPYLRLPVAIGHYWEKQDRRFCWLHAFNMARKACMGNDSITPNEIIHWFKTEQQSPSYEHHRTLLNDTNPNSRPFDPLSGNFNQNAFALWAFLTQGARICHVPMPPRPTPELNANSLINFLTQTLTILQHKQESTLSALILVTRETAGYDHATTLIYEDSEWYWLDSDPTKQYRAILTGPAAETNRKELLTVARSLYSIDHGAHGLHDCPLACVLFSPSPPAPWHLPPIVIPDSPIVTSGRAQPQTGAQPHARAQPYAGAQDLPPPHPLAVQATNGATRTDEIALIARNRGTNTATNPSTRASRRSKTRTNRSKSALEVTKTVAKKRTTDPHQQKYQKITHFYQPYLNVPPPQQIPTPPPDDKHPKHPNAHPPSHSPPPVSNASPPGPHTKPPSHTPNPPTHPPTHPTPPTLSLLQLNAQGSVWVMKEDLITLKLKYKPDIIGICDIGLKAKNKHCKWLTGALEGYQYWMATHTNTEGRASHGVLIAIKDHIAKLSNPQVGNTNTFTGRLLQITLTPPHSQPLSISEIYAPAGDSPEENLTRKNVYQAIINTIHNHPGNYHIYTGDWNATLVPSDRASLKTYEKDTLHREFITSSKLLTTDASDPRTHTYYHPGASSRIDDTFTSFKCGTHTTVLEEGTLSDHSPLLTSINLSGTNIFIPAARPLPTPPSVKTIIRPISDDDRAAFTQAMESYTTGQAHSIQSLHQDLTTITNTVSMPFFDSIDSQDGKSSNRLTTINGCNAATIIQQLSTRLMTIGAASHKLMLETCKTKMTNPSGIHYSKRSVNNQRRRLSKCLRELRVLHREIAREGVITIDTATRLIESKPEANAEILERWKSTLEANDKSIEPSNSASGLVLMAKSGVRQEIKALDKEYNKANLQQAINHNRRMIDKQPKQANRNMRQSANPQNKYPALYDSTAKHRTDDPKRMNEIVTDYFTAALAPPPQGKTGKYLPTEAPRNYPWETDTDKFTLETHASKLTKRPQLHRVIIDPTVFDECVRTLSNGKSPGPDGIENELLKMMPRQFKECIHMLFILMWATGITPDDWKESVTILLEKEGKDGTRIENNRPIGLLDTIYKLWTKLITRAVYDYAEQFGILSTTQKGFRRYANTMDQLQMLVMALEDARLTGQNIYKIQVDFSKAFDMMDHDKMLQVIYDLGIPTDAIDVIKNLYTGASTRVKWGATGITDPISQNRGTIQGDSLSPLLFTLSIEPLLRWLQVGGRGYMFGCLAEDQALQLRTSTSGVAFADDLDILTTSISNVRIQAEKLSHFSDWANMRVNQGKTEVSAMLYRNLITNPGQKGSNQKQMFQQIKAQLCDQIMVQRQYIKFKDPRQPFTYLGAELTMTLDWKYQIQALVTKARKRIQALMASHASPRQIAHNIRTAIIPAVTNTLGITPCTKSDIHLLDSILSQTVKKAHGIPTYGPTAMAHEDKMSGGLGVCSIMVHYATKHAQLLTESLNDEGRQGIITRALLKLQLQLIGDDKLSPREAKYCLRIRQLAQLHQNDLVLRLEDQIQFQTKPHLVQYLLGLNPINDDTPWTYTTHFLHPLLQIGITDLRSLLEPDGQHIIDGRTLRLHLGRRVRAKHIAALNRLSSVANQAPGTDNDIQEIIRTRNTNPLVPRAERRINPRNSYMNLLDTNPVPDIIIHPTLHPEQRLITHFLPRQTPTAMTAPAIPTTLNNAADAFDRPPNPAPHPKRKRQPSKEPMLPKKREPAPQVPLTTLPYQSHAHKETAARLAYNNFLRRHRSQCGAHPTPTWQAKASAAVIDLMYGHTNQIKDIHGWRMTNDAVAHRRSRKRGHHGMPPRPSTEAQPQFQVSWEDTIIEPWALHYFNLAGYKAITTSPINRDDLEGRELSSLHWACVNSCELCHSPHSLEYPVDEDRHDDILLCGTCLRSFHNTCVGDSTRHHIPDNQWQCPACLTCLPAETDKNLLQVSWEPTWESPSTLSCTPEGKMIFDNWIHQHHNQPPVRLGEATLDSHLSNLARQGGDEHATPSWQTTMGDPIRTRITFDIEACTPQLDINPTGECKIEIRQVEVWTPAPQKAPTKRQRPSDDPVAGEVHPPQRPICAHDLKERACCYRADGRCLGTMTAERLTIMKQLYDKAGEAGLHTDLSPPIRSFEEETLDCITRHIKRDKGKPIYDLPTIPPSIHTYFKDAFRANKIRSATPWTIPDCHTPYWSPQTRDKVFGAQGTPHSTQWTGYSQVLASTPDEADAHVRWAIHSAKHASPGTAVATVIYASRSLGTPRKQSFHKWLYSDPDLITHLGHTVGAPFPFHMEHGWTRNIGNHSTTALKHKTVDILIVWNTLGRENITSNPSIHLKDLGHNINATLNQLSHGCRLPIKNSWWMTPIKATTHAHHPAIHKPPRAFRTTPVDMDTSGWITLPSTPPDEILNHYSSDVSSLRHNWRSIVYTDGSCQQVPLTGGGKMNILGAGVYIPAQRAPHRQHAPTPTPTEMQDESSPPSPSLPPDQCITIHPRGHGATNTINRAELSGIWGALDTLHDTPPLHADGRTHTIATDSATSMSQIRRALLSPMDTRRHTHKAAIDAILQAMRSLLAKDPSHRITILKVKAHTGDIGNEMADRTADWATKHPDRCDLTMPADSEPQYNRLYWPHASEPGPDGVKRPRGLSNLTSDLSAHMHQRNRLGTSNKHSYYLNAWQKILPITEGNITNKFMYNPAFNEQKTALNYRFGTLWSNNMARKQHLRTNSTCPLCPKDDGIGHIAGGCAHPTMERMYTERHHTIGRILLRAIAKGRLSAYIAATDLGSAAKSENDGAPHVPFNTLPANLQSILNNHLLPGETRSKPDAIIMIPPESHSVDQRPTLLLLEFKTCRCTDPNPQLTHCHQQHQGLIARLASSYSVKLVPVIIGHSGAVYTQHTLESMALLGIDKDAALKCATKMHIAAIKQLHSIVQTRRHLEHGSEPRPSDPSQKQQQRPTTNATTQHHPKRLKHRHDGRRLDPP